MLLPLTLAVMGLSSPTTLDCRLREDAAFILDGAGRGFFSIPCKHTQNKITNTTPQTEQRT